MMKQRWIKKDNILEPQRWGSIATANDFLETASPYQLDQSLAF